MSQPLAIYLHDHLAGSAYALDLVEAMQKNYASAPLGLFAARLHMEISADKETLQGIARLFGPASDPVKDTAAWLGEKISRIKMNQSDGTGLGTFEALEFLALGIHGKLALWRALSEIVRHEPKLEGIDFGRLIARAEEQEQSVEQYRLSFAHKALTGASSNGTDSQRWPNAGK